MTFVSAWHLQDSLSHEGDALKQNIADTLHQGLQGEYNNVELPAMVVPGLLMLCLLD